MKLDIIKTKDYLFAVDKEAKIIEGDWCLNKNKDTTYKKDKYPMDISWIKIIAHLPLNNTAPLEGVPLLPELEDEGTLLSFKKYPFRQHTISDRDANEDFRTVFIGGYKAAGGWSDADILKAVEIAHTWSLSAADVLSKLKKSKLPIAYDSETKQYIYE